jgi:unsaturated rhamnogalacturonyl hydrolase
MKTMKNFIFFNPILVLVFLHSFSFGQDIESFILPYADDIIEKTAFEFKDVSTDMVYSSTVNLDINQHLVIESKYARWGYTSALVYDGLRELGILLEKPSYVDFGNRANAFFFDNKAYYLQVRESGYGIDGLQNFSRFRGLWDDGAQTAALINSYSDKPREDYLQYFEKVAEFFFQYDDNQKNRRTPQMSNVDHIYAECSFMARMGKLTGETKYFDYCVRKAEETEKFHLDRSMGLYDQIYYPDLQITNHIKWLRGMGWASMGLADILDNLPKDHPGYQQVLGIYQKIMIGVSAYQTKTGLWRHLVDRADCFEEPSGSAYIVYALAKGVNRGWLDPRYRDVAMAGWRGIVQARNADGEFINVPGTVSNSISPTYYYNNTIDKTHDYMMGPLLLAGAEMIKLYKKYNKPATGNWIFEHEGYE